MIRGEINPLRCTRRKRWRNGAFECDGRHLVAWPARDQGKCEVLVFREIVQVGAELVGSCCGGDAGYAVGSDSGCRHDKIGFGSREFSRL